MRTTKYLAQTTLTTFLALALSLPAFAESPPIRLCRSYVQGRIDVVDAELHKGSKPNEARRLVKRRDKLRAQLAACERNPLAYKKDI